MHYPVSCSPQAWASGTFFLLLQSVLGLEPDAPNQRLVIRAPRLPRFLDHLELDGLRVGNAWVSLRFGRHDSRTHVDVVAVSGAAARHDRSLIAAAQRAILRARSATIGAASAAGEKASSMSFASLNLSAMR